MSGSRWRGARSTATAAAPARRRGPVARHGARLIGLLVVPLVAVALVVAAAVTVTAPKAPLPPPATDAQLRSMMEAYIADRAPGYGRSGRARPPSEPLEFVRFVTDAEWATVMRDCVAEKGATSVNFGPEQFIDWVNTTGEDFALEVAALQYCWWAYPTEALREKLQSPQELDFRYNYYRTQLVPCLRSMGRTPVDLPDRDVFMAAASANLFIWNPYDRFTLDGTSDTGGLHLSVAEPQRTRQMPVALLRLRCPAEPAGTDLID